MKTRKRRIGIWQGGLALVLVLALAGPAAAAPIWLQLNPTPDPNYGSPTPRVLSSAIFNPATNRMVVFGGNPGGYAQLNDVWILTNADGTGGTPAWKKLNPLTPNGAPAPRYCHAAVYDQANNRMIIHGGHTMAGYCEGFVGDVWILTNADGTGGTPAWIPLAPTGTAPIRRDHQAAYDAANNRLIIHGGNTTGFNPWCYGYAVDDSYVLTNANGLGGGSPAWTALDAAFSIPNYENPGTGPGGYDPASNTMVDFLLFTEAGVNVNALRVLSNANGLGGAAAWSDLAPIGDSPPMRTNERGVYDAERNQLIIFGGIWSTLLNDTWRLVHANGQGGPPQWTQLNPTGALPAARARNTAVYNPVSNRMIIFGGGWDFILNDVWVLTEAMGPLTVPIDIMPWILSNRINLMGLGLIDVAILSSKTFNAAAMVNSRSITFGRKGDEQSLAFVLPFPLDVNGDKRADLLCFFYTSRTGFKCGDKQGVLKGFTKDGRPIEGVDSVTIFPCK